MRDQARKAGLPAEIDSAGTGDWHVGSAPDNRAIAVARANGADISTLRARQVTADDFHRFDHIVAMDRANLQALRALHPSGAKARLSLLLDHVEGRKGQAVADPYYGAHEHFERTWSDVQAGTAALIRQLQRER